MMYVHLFDGHPCCVIVQCLLQISVGGLGIDDLRKKQKKKAGEW